MHCVGRIHSLLMSEKIKHWALKCVFGGEGGKADT
jgi:hypothetical protein